ncbi:MAG: arginase family protein [Candidatus Diapherotrites archaeon]|nr:arginase family protein [Candidatus Diapherotrites archaeon]
MILIIMLIVKIPSEQGSLGKNAGCAEAPDIILDRLSKQKVKFSAEEIPVFENDIIATDESIYKNAKRLLGKKPVFVGGDHSITYALFRAFSEVYGAKNSALVVFDAHADATQVFKPVSHEDMNRMLVEEGILKRQNLLLVGLRKIWEQEAEWLREKKINVIRAVEIRKNIANAVSKIEEFAKNPEIRHIYISVDADVFDPGIMPATGYLEEKGLDENEFFGLLDALLNSKKVKAADFVEYNPKKDIDEKGLGLTVRVLNSFVHI